MIYRLMGRMHLLLGRVARSERGQGTVEYVALILLVAALLAGIVAATKGSKFSTGGIAETIIKQMKQALESIK
jgi:nitrate reductase gamma subunit